MIVSESQLLNPVGKVVVFCLHKPSHVGMRPHYRQHLNGNGLVSASLILYNNSMAVLENVNCENNV